MFNKYSIILLLFLLINSLSKNEVHFSKERILSEDCQEETIIPNSENVKYIGRFYIEDDVTQLVLSGSSIEFYLTGKSAQINLIGDSSAIYLAEDQRPRYEIYIDDKQLIDTTMGELEKTIKLFNDEEEKETKIRIILLSEASHGGIGIKNIIVNSCSEKIIKPTEYRDLRIEYLGDSITCDFGIESASESEPFKTTTQNFELTYAFLSAQELNADYSCLLQWKWSCKGR